MSKVDEIKEALDGKEKGKLKEL